MDRYQRRQRLDRLSAGLARWVGMLVLLLVVLLLGYLVIAAAPVLLPAQPETRSQYPGEPGTSRLLVFSPDQTRITRVLEDGQVLRFAAPTGLLYHQSQLFDRLDLNTDGQFQVRQLIDTQQREYLLIVTHGGQVDLLMWQADGLTDQHRWPARFFLANSQPVAQLTARLIDDELQIGVAQQDADTLTVSSYLVPSEDQAPAEQRLSVQHAWTLPTPIAGLLLLRHDQLLVTPVAGGMLQLDVAQTAQTDMRVSPVAIEHSPKQLAGQAMVFTSIQHLKHNMLLTGGTDGRLYQWALTSDAGDITAPRLQLAASYSCGAQNPLEVTINGQGDWLGCIDGQQRGHLFYRGREAAIWHSKASAAVHHLAFTEDKLLVDNDSSLQYLQRDGGPVLDGRLLWQPVWYAGYSQPEWIWQPSPGKHSEAKFSVTPLLFGTLKAALLAIFFGIPLAILGAIYTSLILPRVWRERLKPVVEMLEAMPTVIIGFLAAVWLAPYLQNHLLVCLLFLFGLPVSLVLLGYYWSRMLSKRVNPGWHTWLPLLLIGLLITVLVTVGWLLEWWLFGGQLSGWLEQQWGWTYDLRNALVVGVALGLAITPTIFALCEDALTAVPRHLRMGAVALGASRWQTVWQVIVPCAASGLLAAILIGLGRALGETMIVLMAASNTPLIELSPLRGLQAIAPTLAIEMPEADPGGLHFRVLLLAALVLFLITLLANTLAELIRERLRRRYQL